MRRWLALVALAVVVIVAASAVIAARFARPIAERFLTDVTGTPVSIGGLSLHPTERRVVAKALTLGPPGAQLAVADLSATIALRPLWSGDIVINAAQLAGLVATVDIDPSFRVSLAGLPAAREEHPRGSSAQAAPARVVRIDQLTVTDARLSVHHALQGKAQQIAVRVDELTARDTAVHSDGTGLRLDADLRGTADGNAMKVHIGVTPAAAAQRVDVRADLSGMQLPQELVAVPPAVSGLTGKLSGSLAYHSAPAPNESPIDVALQLDALHLSGQEETSVSARAVAIDGLHVDPDGRRIDIGTVLLDEPSVVVALTPEGIVLPLAAPQRAASQQPEAPWTVTGGAVKITGGSATLRRDQDRYELAIESGHWQGIASGRPGSVEINSRSAGGGTLRVSGTLGFDPADIGLTISADDVALAAAAAVLPELPLRIAKGTASGRISISGPLERVRVKGSLSLDEIHTAPPANHPDEVLAVHRVEAELSIDPNRREVEVASLKLQYPYIMVQRSARGIFPYSSFERGGQSAATGEAATTVRIKELEIQGGRADFLDRVVEPNYWTALANLAATAGPVVLPGPKIGDFRVTARQDEIAPVEASGSADARGWQLRTDLRAVFLPSLNGYLAPLLGYKADTGVLSLDVDGRFAPDALRTRNTVTLRNVALSQTGLDVIQRNTGVPLPIALALLKDTSGTVELDVPVHGDPRSGRFEIGSVIGQALSKAIQGALATPLKLLGLLFGKKGPPRALAIDPIPFAVGSGKLDVTGEARLDQIAHILAAHTEVTLVAKPEVSAEDAAVVGSDGLERLAAERAKAVTAALFGGHIQPELPRRRVVMVPWKAARDGGLAERSGVYVEMQLSADYGR
jgi:hypothetical protein